MANIYGYFTDAQQSEPAHDPGLDVDCPVCHKRLSRPIKTISVMLAQEKRSYFYRTHKACYDALNAEEAGNLDGILMDAMDEDTDE